MVVVDYKKKKLPLIIIIFLLPILSFGYNKHEHFGDLFTPQQFHAAQGSGDIGKLSVGTKMEQIRKATDQVLKVMVNSDIAIARSNSPDPTQVANYKIRRKMYRAIAAKVKQEGPPFDYNKIMKKTIEHLKSQHPKKINSFYTQNLPQKFEDLISYTSPSPNLTGKENVFSEMGKLRNQILQKMDKKQILKLYEEFKKTPRINRSVIDVSIAEDLFDKLKEIMGEHPLAAIQGDGTRVNYLLTYNPYKGISEGDLKKIKELKIKDPYFRGIDVVPSMLEHIDGADLPPHTKLIDTYKEILTNPDYDNIDLRLHAFEGNVNAHTAYNNALLELLEEEGMKENLIDRNSHRGGQLRIGHSGGMTEDQIKRIAALDLGNSLTVEFNPRTYLELDSTQDIHKVRQNLKMLLDNNLNVVFGSDSYGKYVHSCGSKEICRSSFTSNLGEVIRGGDFSDDQIKRLMVSLHNNDLPRKDIIQVLDTMFEYDDPNRATKIGEYLVHVLEICGK